MINPVGPIKVCITVTSQCTEDNQPSYAPTTSLVRPVFTSTDPRSVSLPVTIRWKHFLYTLTYEFYSPSFPDGVSIVQQTGLPLPVLHFCKRFVVSLLLSLLSRSTHLSNHPEAISKKNVCLPKSLYLRSRLSFSCSVETYLFHLLIDIDSST